MCGLIFDNLSFIKCQTRHYLLGLSFRVAIVSFCLISLFTLNLTMDYSMKINYLKKDMLIHELTVRGIPVDDSTTVESLRSTLRPLIQMEKKSKTLNYPAYSLSFDEEKTHIRVMLDKLQSSIPNVKGEKAKTKFERYQTHLVHLLNRVDRAPIDKLSPNQVDARAGLLVEILSTLDKLEQISKQDPNLSVMLSATHLDDSDSDSSFAAGDNQPPVSTPHRASMSAPPSKFQRVEKWGLKFTGDQKGMSVHSFLERVSELMVARNVCERELFESAIDLFSGKALNWYRSNRSRFADWRGLSDLLCRHFEPPDYRPRLFKEILERTQDPAESIVDYLSSMHALFRRYGQMTEDVQLDIITRNLAPFYTTQLPVVRSLETLEEECLKLEAKKFRAEHYVPPSRKRHGFVEPDFAFIEAHSSAFNRVESPLPAVNEIQQPTPRHFPPTRILTCWNCNQTGHLNRQCPNPRKIHCYRCGAQDVTIKSCPKCSPSGNGSRESH